MKKWLKSTGIKTAKTMAQSAAGAIGAAVLLSEVNWTVVISTALISGVMCVLMNISKIEEDD